MSLIAGAAERSDRPKRQLLIDPLTQADSRLPAQHTPQSERLVLALPFRKLPFLTPPSFDRLLSVVHAPEANIM